jgi:hypothetical protein
MAPSLSASTDRSTNRRPRPASRRTSSWSSAWPTPGGASFGSAVRHQRLDPFSGSSKTATWSTPVIVPTTPPSHSATRCMNSGVVAFSTSTSTGAVTMPLTA